MATSALDRNRASRVRARLAKGTATDLDRQWLASYESSRSRQRARTVPVTPPPATWPQAFWPHAAQARASAHAQAPQPAQSQAPESSSSGEHVIDFGPEPAAHGQPPPGVAPGFASHGTGPAPNAAGSGPVCTIPNCSACKMVKGSQTCAVTGKRVWPPMSERGAKALAGAICMGIGFIAKLFRRDHELIVPTAEEVAKLGESIREVALRRASWAGAVDDIFALFWDLGAFTRRAFTAPSPAKPQPPPPPKHAAPPTPPEPAQEPVPSAPEPVMDTIPMAA